jgi:RimJ/RimL family protein N-acetyltransferase/aryl carrier-like protein
MTTVDNRTRAADTPRGTNDQREADRHELAELLDLDPAALHDSARLHEELGLDSLARLTLLTWLETRGVLVRTDRDVLASVGDVLALLEKSSSPGLSITVVGPDPRTPGAADTALPHATGPAPALAGALVPRLATPALRLTPVEPDDIGFLYMLATAPETGFRWRYRGAPPPFERFAEELWGQVLVQYVARRAEDHQPVGHVVAYAATQGLRHAHLGAVFHPPYAGSGLAAQAVSLFVNYLFHTFPLRKLYLEIPGFNWPQMQSGAGRLFHVEGILRDHDYYAGQTWDSYLCAIYPDLMPAEQQ